MTEDRNVIQYYITGRDSVIAIVYMHPTHGRTLVIVAQTMEPFGELALMTPDGKTIKEKSILNFLFSMIPMEQEST